MKLKTILIALLGTSAFAAAPAFADRGHGRGHDRHHWKHSQHQQFRGHHHYDYAPRRVVVVPAPPVVYRTPAQVYYAPTPVIDSPSFGAGAISIRLNLPL